MQDYMFTVQKASKERLFLITFNPFGCFASFPGEVPIQERSRRLKVLLAKPRSLTAPPLEVQRAIQRPEGPRRASGKSRWTCTVLPQEAMHQNGWTCWTPFVWMWDAFLTVWQLGPFFLEPFCALSNICFRKLWQWSLRCFPFSIWPNVVPHQRACCQWVAILCGFDVVEFRAQWNLLFWVASKSTALAGQHMTGYPSATIEWIWKHDGWEKVLYQWNFSDSISASPTSLEPKPWPWRQDILQDKCIGYVNQALKTFMELSCNSFAFELVVNTFCSASSFFGCQSDPDSKFLLHQVSFVEETLSPRLFHV